jgi:hypothetical protein
MLRGGTGIIGVIYGWVLPQAGVDVIHFVRKGKADEFKDGVTLDVLDERKGHPKYNVTKYVLKCVQEYDCISLHFSTQKLGSCPAVQSYSSVQALVTHITCVNEV